MPQLDGLRAFAVLGVAVSHWTPDFLAGIVPWGTGVQLFFVLSGFLITGILLRSRPAESGTTLGTALRVFYVRRALRIFPIYYAVLAVSLALALGSMRETWPWHFSYLSNFHYAFNTHGDAISDPFLHFWSLGVEEQFYLFWPFFALVLSRRALPVVLGVTLLVAVVFRVRIDQHVPGIVSIRYLTPACLDAFAVGAVIAYVKQYYTAPAVRKLGWVLAAIGLIGLVGSVVFLPRMISGEAAHRIGHTFLVIFYGALVTGAAQGFGGVPGKVLGFGPVVYLGVISYGIYIYHYFAPLAINRLFAGAAETGQRTAVLVLLYTAFTLGLSIASWHLFEAPINRLKRLFPYPRLLDGTIGEPDATRPALSPAGNPKQFD